LRERDDAARPQPTLSLPMPASRPTKAGTANTFGIARRSTGYAANLIGSDDIGASGFIEARSPRLYLIGQFVPLCGGLEPFRSRHRPSGGLCKGTARSRFAAHFVGVHGPHPPTPARRREIATLKDGRTLNFVGFAQPRATALLRSMALPHLSLLPPILTLEGSPATQSILLATFVDAHHRVGAWRPAGPRLPSARHERGSRSPRSRLALRRSLLADLLRGARQSPHDHHCGAISAGQSNVWVIEEVGGGRGNRRNLPACRLGHRAPPACNPPSGTRSLVDLLQLILRVDAKNLRSAASVAGPARKGTGKKRAPSAQHKRKGPPMPSPEGRERCLQRQVRWASSRTCAVSIDVVRPRKTEWDAFKT
jgi:hypothetical protein